MISLEKFIENTKGTAVDFPNVTEPTNLKGQCVTLVQNYIYSCLGQPYTARGHAKSWIKSYVNEGLGKTVSDQKDGDLIVFKKEANGLGHIGIWYKGQIYDQNNLRHDNGLAGLCDIFSWDFVTLRPNVKKDYILYNAHVQDKGWLGEVAEGQTCGTTGQALRLEAIKINSNLDIEAKAHIQDEGWKDYGKINKDTIIGTTGQAKRLECLCLKGNFKYRVHIQDTGWTNWTNADGISTLGTVGQALRMEAIEIKRLS